MTEKAITGPEAIKQFFGSEGYPKVTNSELLKFKKDDPEGYEEVRDACLAELS